MSHLSMPGTHRAALLALLCLGCTQPEGAAPPDLLESDGADVDAGVPSDLSAGTPDGLSPAPDLAGIADLAAPDAAAPPRLYFDNPRTPPGVCGPMWLLHVRSAPLGINCGFPGATECSAPFPAGTAVKLYPVLQCPGVRLVRWTGACGDIPGTECKLTTAAADTYAGVDLAVDHILTVRNRSTAVIRVIGSNGPLGNCTFNFNSVTVPSHCTGNPCCLTAYGDSRQTIRATTPVRWGGACAGVSLECQLTVSGATEVTVDDP